MCDPAGADWEAYAAFLRGYGPQRFEVGLPIAYAPDGVPEAMERTDGPFGLFVQWHPESMEDAKHRRAIYTALIDACKRD